MSDGDNYWLKRRYSRRTALRGSAVGAAGVGAWAVAGCGDDDDDDDGGTTPAPTTGGAATTAAAGSPTAVAGAPKSGSYYSTLNALVGTTMDMHRELYRGSIAAQQLAYNNLVVWKNVDKAQLGVELAQSLPEQPDPRTFTFKLRQDVKWQNKAPVNGRALTMDDIKWNIERQRTQKLASGETVKNMYRNGTIYSDKLIEKVEYVDATTFKITLTNPDATFLTTFADEFNVIQAKENTERTEATDEFGKLDPKYIIGTGPYIFDKYDPTSGAHAARNPDYWGKKANLEVQFLDEIFWLNLGVDFNAHKIAFEQKQIDIVSATLHEQIDAIVSANSGAQKIEIPNPNFNIEMAWNWNHPNNPSPLFGNPDLRMAIHLATDRNLIIQQQFGGKARPNPGINWPFTAWALPQDELLKQPGYRTPKDQDIKDARALWEKGGGAAIDKKWFEYVIVDSNPSAAKLREWFPAMMNTNLGTDKFSIKTVPVATLLELNVTGTNGVGYLGGWDQWISPDPRGRFAQVYSGGPRGTINFWKYSSTDMEAILTKAFAEFDLVKAQALMKDAQRQVLKDAGAGHTQMAAGVVPIAMWKYVKREGPSFISYERQLGRKSWIDTSDPSAQGRKKPS